MNDGGPDEADGLRVESIDHREQQAARENAQPSPAKTDRRCIRRAFNHVLYAFFAADANRLNNPHAVIYRPKPYAFLACSSVIKPESRSACTALRLRVSDAP